MSSDYVRSAPGSDPILVEGYFAAEPASVFEAFTDPAIVKKWFGPTPHSLHSASVDLRPGGTWRFVESEEEGRSVGFEGAYLEIEPGQKLVFTWTKFVATLGGERDATPESRVEVRFEARGEGTFVRLAHSAMHSDAVRRGFAGGWGRGFGALGALWP